MVPAEDKKGLSEMVSRGNSLPMLKYPLTTLLFAALAVAIFGYYATKLQLDVSADSLLLENDKDLAYYREIRARYGSDDYLILTYRPKGDLFKRAQLSRLDALSKRLAGIGRIGGITSILNVPLLESPPISLAEFSRDPPTLASPDTDPALAKRELRNSPLYRNRLLSADGGTTAMQLDLKHDKTYLDLRDKRNALREARLDKDLTTQQRRQLATLSERFDRYRKRAMRRLAGTIRQLRKVIGDYRALADIHLGGVPMIVTDMMNYVRHDLRTFGFAVLLMLALDLFIAFRDLRWVLLPLLSAALAGVVSTGLLGMLRWPVTVISSNYIALLLIFCLSLIIHLIVRYLELQQAQPDSDHRERIALTLHSKALPCLYTVITTMVAFASLTFSHIRPVIDFGWIMVFTLAISLLFAFTLFPAALALLKPLALRERGTWIAGFSRRCASLALNHARAILGVSALLTLIGLFGMSRLSVENRFIDYFHDDTEIHQGMQLIDRKLGGTMPLDVIVDAPHQQASVASAQPEWLDPSFARQNDEGGITASSYWFNLARLDLVEKIHNYLDGLQATGKVLSLHTTMQAFRTLQSDSVIDDFFLSVVYRRMPEAAKTQLIHPYLSDTGDQLRFALRLHETGTGLNRQALFKRIRNHLTGDMGLDPAQVHMSGLAVLYNNLLQSLFRSQIESLGFVLLVVAATFVMLFRSFRVAAIATLPNLMSVALVLGLVGLFGIPLDIMTITIAAITLGIAVDDTIHYIHRHREEWRRGHDYAEATYRAHHTVGCAMVYTALAIAAGFAVMIVSEFMPTVYFGCFTAFSMVSALLIDMLLLPVLLNRLKPYDRTDRRRYSAD